MSGRVTIPSRKLAVGYHIAPVHPTRTSWLSRKVDATNCRSPGDRCTLGDPAMPDLTPSSLTLLDELDARQNDVLDQLDELNRRIEQLLAEFSGQPRQAAPAPTSEAA